MSRTYGELRWLAPGQFGKRACWAFRAEPHVVMRLKRVFPRLAPWQAGWLTVTDTPEVCRDLQWCLERWPLRDKDGSLARLDAGARHHRAVEEELGRILGGGQGRLSDLPAPLREPRDYQRLAGDVILGGGGRLLIGDDVGLGKTFTSMLTLLEPDALPAVFVTLTHLPAQMQAELEQSIGGLTSHVVRSRRAYDPAKRRGAKGERPDVLFLTYSKLSGWGDRLAGQARTVIFDEVQELRRPGTDKWWAAKRIADEARYVIGLTATPVYNYGDEAHTIFDVISPGILGDRSEFVREWGASSGSGHVMVADPTALGTYLRDQGVLLARTRKQVGRELPPVVRVTQHVDADPDELDRIATDTAELARLVLATDTGRRERFEAAGDLDWKLRQATGIAKAPYVAAFVRLLLESEQRVVLWGWHRAVYDLWLELLADLNPRLYTGSESPTQKRAAVKDFLDGDSRVLLMSLRAGAGLDGLQGRCGVGVFGELDWSPGIHHQCIGRLARDGQGDEPVVAYFLVADDGSDPAVAEVLQLKRGQSEPLMDPNARPFEAVPANADRVRMLAASVLARRGESLPEGAPDPQIEVDGQEALDLDTGTG